MSNTTVMMFQETYFRSSWVDFYSLSSQLLWSRRACWQNCFLNDCGEYLKIIVQKVYWKRKRETIKNCRSKSNSSSTDKRHVSSLSARLINDTVSLNNNYMSLWYHYVTQDIITRLQRSSSQPVTRCPLSTTNVKHSLFVNLMVSSNLTVK